MRTITITIVRTIPNSVKLTDGGIEPDLSPGMPRLHKQLRVIELTQLHPEQSYSEIARIVGIRADKAKKVIDSDYAQSRAEIALDVRPLVRQKLKSNVIISLDYLKLAINKGLEELKRRRPSSSVIFSPWSTPVSTLTGTGVFQEHQNIQNSAPSASELASIMDRAEQLRSNLINYSKNSRSEPGQKKLTPGGTGGPGPALGHPEPPSHDTEPNSEFLAEPLVVESVTPQSTDNEVNLGDSKPVCPIELESGYDPEKKHVAARSQFNSECQGENQLRDESGAGSNS